MTDYGLHDELPADLAEAGDEAVPAHLVEDDEDEDGEDLVDPEAPE